MMHYVVKVGTMTLRMTLSLAIILTLLVDPLPRWVPVLHALAISRARRLA